MCVSCVRVVPCATVIQLSRTLFIAILIALDGEKAPKVSIAAYLVNPTLTEKKKKEEYDRALYATRIVDLRLA